MHDVLGDVLATLQLQSSVYCQSEIYAQGWALDFQAISGAAFHIVSEGCCWLIRGTDRVPVERGDLVILPQGDAHFMADAPDAPVCAHIHLIDDNPQSWRLLRWGDEALSTILVCGTFTFGAYSAGSILAQLPPVLHFTAGASRRNGLHMAIEALIDEANADRQGKEAVLHRLADILFVKIIRAALGEPVAATRGWLAGLRDAQVAAALTAIHADPTRSWTVASMAQQAAMSRSAFAARFAELVGRSPIEYLSEWRMQMASSLLGQSGLSLAQVAEQIGYSSDIAFSKAFKRQYGISPAAYRRLRQAP